MSARRSVLRVLVAVGVFATSGLVWTVAVAAAGHDINVTNDPAKCDKTWGPPCFTPANGSVTTVNVGDTVTWHVLDGTHTVSPTDGGSFAGSGDLTGPDGNFNVTFDHPGVYTFYCKHHGQVDKDGKTFHGMWGKIDVKGEATTATTGPAAAAPPDTAPPKSDPGPPPPTSKPAPPPPSSPPPPPPSSSNGSASSGNSGSPGSGQTANQTGRPYVGPPPTSPAAPPAREAAAAPPPARPAATETKASPKDGNSTDSTSTPGATAVPPEDAVRPAVPQFAPPTTAPALVPTGAPQGDTVALLKPEPGGKHRKLILFATVFGVGAFAAGVGGWKYLHRASKYWPA